MTAKTEKTSEEKTRKKLEEKDGHYTIVLAPPLSKTTFTTSILRYPLMFHPLPYMIFLVITLIILQFSPPSLLLAAAVPSVVHFPLPTDSSVRVCGLSSLELDMMGLVYCIFTRDRGTVS